MIKNTKKLLSLILALVLALSCAVAVIFTANAVDTGESASAADALGGKFATNPGGQVGVRKTISVDGDKSDWDSSMLIAQGVANDDPRVYRPNSMYEIAMDDYALYAAWDDTNLYLMWECANVQDVVAPNDDFPLSQGNLWINNMPIFIAFNTGLGTASDGTTSNGGTLWNSGITYSTPIDTVIAISTNGANGPFIYPSDSNGKVGVEKYAYADTGIQLKWGNGKTLSGELIGIDKAYGTYNDRVPGDTLSDSSAWVDFYQTGHSASLDMFYEMSVPLEKLGITASHLESNGIGIMKIATFGTSGMDSLPYDPSMSDNAALPYSGQENNSNEKEDEDNITVPLAQIGNMGGSVPSTTAPATTEPPTTTVPATTEPPTTTEPSSSQTAPVFTSEQLKALGMEAGTSDNEKAVSYCYAHMSEILSGTDEATTQVIYINLYYLYYGVLPDGVTELPYDPAVPTDPPETTEPQTTEPPVTTPVGDKELSVTAKSNLADATTKVVSTEDNNRVNVSYYLKSSQLLSGAQWQLTYDKTKLKLASSNYDAQGDLKVMPVADEVGDAVSNLPEEGRAKGSFQGSKNVYDFSGDGVLVSVDFDIIGTGYADVSLDVQYVTYITDSNVVNTMVDDSVKTSLYKGTVTQFITASYDSDAEKLLGDVNCDKQVDITDAAAIQLYKAKLLAPTAVFDESVADYNRDGVIDILDAARIQLVLAHLA